MEKERDTDKHQTTDTKHSINISMYGININNIVDSNGQDCIHFIFNGTKLTNDQIKDVIRQTLGEMRVKLTAEKKLLNMDTLDACVDPCTRMVAVVCPLVSLEFKHVDVQEGMPNVHAVVTGSSKESVVGTQLLANKIEAIATSIIA